MSKDHLDVLLAAAGVDGSELAVEDVGRVCGLLGLDGDDPITDEVADEIGRLGRPTDGEVPADAYGFRVGQWRVGLAGQGVRTAVLSAVVAASLVQRGFGEVAIGMATVVIPTVLDVEKVELRAGDRRLLLRLRLKEAVRDGFMTEDELYATLPDDVRRVVNPFDFADFVARLREVGLVEGDEWMRTRDPDDGRPLIDWR
ncbi:MAG TPA: hypothetical protein VK507_18290 [Iamia sp.]|nr:hypothetical protein [Iamia sp.]